MLYLIYINILLLISYFTGHLILHLLSLNVSRINARLFLKTIIGFFFLVIFYSFCKAGFKTINSLLILSVFLMLRLECSDLTFKKIFYPIQWLEIKNDMINYFYSLPFLILFFAWQYYFICYNTTSFPTVVEWDNRFTTDLAMFLNHYGKETLTWDTIFTNELGNSPYHYIEGWSVAFVAFMFKTNYWLLLQLTVIPLYQFFILIGVWSVFEIIFLDFKIKFFSVLLIYISGFYLPTLSNFALFQYPFTWFYGFNAMDEPWFFKISIVYLVLICCTLLFLHKKYESAIIVLLTLSIFSINIAPSILSATFLFLFILFVTSKNKIKKDIDHKVITYPILYAALILLFYKILGANQIVEIPSMDIILQDLLPQTPISRTEVIIFIEKIISVMILYAPYLLLIALNFKTINGIIKDDIMDINRFYKSLLYFIVIMLPTSITIWYALRMTYGVWEMFYTSFLPIIHYLIFLSIYLLLTRTTKPLWLNITNHIIVFSILFFLAFRSIKKSMLYKSNFESLYQNEFINTVKKNSEGINTMGLKIQHKSDFENSILYNPFLNLSALYLSNVFDSYSLINISFGDIEIDKLKNEVDKKQVFSSPYLKFKKQEREKKSDITDDELLIMFIKKHKIEYLITDVEYEIKTALKPFIIKIIDNEFSKERFILINPQTNLIYE